MAIVVCFSGKIGSGKSSIISELSNALGWKQVAFGHYVRQQVARLGGDANSREVLQNFGQRFVEADPEAFCRGLLKSADYDWDENLLVDGVRHVKIFDMLQTVLLPAKVRLIHLSLADELQQIRVEGRNDSADLDRARGHVVEAELGSSLPRRADLIVNSDREFEQIIYDCLAAIRGWTA
ncbi:AAA family ATPase [Agrobacterium tumefaciens]|uniref:AAA family ATPase n=1 Tax=Agrobacterium tumefaciens TaxID=358 RepID=UPI0015739EA4|nr:AAA family ATPase [Agrobacterium tumefaciens]NTA18890.1 AAA family ATPase [Agrobacterium tumefaciens]WCK72411.1 AAA family ATPase [Agrobacterium tumefaciens]